MKRGEKDYEPDGTDAQQQSLRLSRAAMYSALSAERVHSSKSVLIADWDPRMGRARVIQLKGNFLLTMGISLAGEQWLEPEEVEYLVERGSLLCYFRGHLLSVQDTAALCLPCVSSEYYQVYSHLRRLGYIVRRAPEVVRSWPALTVNTDYPSAFSLLLSTILDRPRLAWRRSYPSYPALARDLRVYQIPRSDTDANSMEMAPDFFVWRPGTKFRKSEPPEPQFRVRVCRATDPLPSSKDMAALLASERPVKSSKKSVPSRMRDGTRSAILAVVDCGVVAFIRVVDTLVEPLF